VAQLDGSLTLLPAWMTEPEAAALEVVSQPRISRDALISLRRIVDAAVSSQAGMARDGGERERSEAAAAKPAAGRPQSTASAGDRKRSARAAGATTAQRTPRNRKRGRKA